MRPHLLLAFPMLAAAFPIRSAAQSPRLADIAGHWSGDGAYFDPALRTAAGSIPIALELSRDGTGSGRVGGATLRAVRLRERRELVEVTARLEDPARIASLRGKDHLVLLFTHVTGDSAVAEFHLKSNATFDPRMREGRVILRRTEDQRRVPLPTRMDLTVPVLSHPMQQPWQTSATVIALRLEKTLAKRNQRRHASRRGRCS